MRNRKLLKFISSSFLAVVIALAIPGKTFAYSVSFSDVNEGDSHYKGIMALAEEGIINGYEDGTFGTSDSITRGQVAVMLSEALDVETPENINQVLEVYHDVNRDTLYAEQIAAVTKKGVFKGSNGEFNPTEPITREQMATVLVLGMELADYESANDVEIYLNNVSSSHRERVQTLANLGITNQLDNFRPAEATERGQFATFLYETMKVTGMLGNEYITVSYDISFFEAMNSQTSPKVDGAGQFTASRELTEYYANPNNFTKDSPEFFQFLKLSYEPGTTAGELNNRILKDKGALKDTGQSFLNAAQQNDINVIYLMAHALHETGNGTSELANGLKVGLNKDGKATYVTHKNKDKLTNIKTVYNMFGVGAYDGCANSCGAEHAYEEGWFTPKAAVLGGASFIDDGYIGRGQDTLYKMRWNPDNPGYPQYATHVQWAAIQARNIAEMYELAGLLDTYTLRFDIPQYQNQPEQAPEPTGEDRYSVDTSNAGDIYKVKTSDGSGLNIRTYPWGDVIRALPEKTEVEVIGENGGWYKVEANGTEGWVSGKYLVSP
ncbi:hypothetical protein GCM10007063_28700 [Lentibacillus kapialis]|uniref:SLH domain-containing protein n=1 Tax=Lentibacillus kapialis TaxID=340214 RepID=A0A917Q0Z4_9BACI|nr:S-layer homology domain-containing protein [Lentibacillus kapialis]GGK04633.1 hypothetical protein GCM10007063_28700 [Lentibacillus kapialis]